MFRTAELGHKVPKEEYKQREIILRQELLETQQELLKSGKFPVIIIFAGVDGAGKAQTVNLLNEWMDPRWIVNRAFDEPSKGERERPPFWRYWLTLPPHGQIGLFLSAWYSTPLSDRVRRRTTPARFDAALDQIAAFEEMLAADGALVLKFWLHLSRRDQKRRLEALSADPLSRWRVTKAQWKQHQRYGRWVAAAERAIARTSFEHAPWFIVDGADERYRNLAVATGIRDALARALGAAVPTAPRGKGRRRPAPIETSTPAASGLVARIDRDHSVLDVLDMTPALSKSAFKTRLLRQQGRLNALQRRAQSKGRSLVLLFEGWDAAGKGGAIRRVVAALDPRCYRVIPVGAPSDEERARHYLWRFWRHLSRAGRVTIFDRSWYGRVLVERV
jgi:polyphosphate:AMP phosphotransferase